MGTENLFWGYWYYQLPNYLLGVLTWTCVGRFLLGFFFPPDARNYIWRTFRRLTDPVIRLTAMITPSFVVPVFYPLIAVFWLFVVRLLFYMVMHYYGLTPPIQPVMSPAGTG